MYKKGGGDIERLPQMMSGDLLTIWDIEPIDYVRKHDPVEGAECDRRRLSLEIEGVQPIDYARDLLRPISFES